MKTRTIILTLLVCFAAGAVCFASDAWMGTWKLNESKSKIGAGMQKNDTVVYEASGDNVKVTVDGTNGEGKATHDEWTGMLDGKDYPLTGDPTADTRAYTKVNGHTLKLNEKKDGKIIMSGRLVISPDGKTRTLTLSGTNPMGKSFKLTEVYDKQ
jgi:hypothetical protein